MEPEGREPAEPRESRTGDGDSASRGDGPGGSASGPDLDIFGRAPRDHPDWSHRRGEPRVFALAWTLFLMAATALMLLSMSAAVEITAETYRPAARTLLVVVAFGVLIGWPMFRLSQAAPGPDGGPVRAVVVDLLVVLLPIQPLIWPHAWPGRWPLESMAAVSALLASWACLVGALLVVALDRVECAERGGARHSASRAGWMVVFVLLAASGPAWMLIRGATVPPDVGSVWVEAMFSPFTGIGELLRDRSATGQAAVVLPAHVLAIQWTAALAIAAWAGVGLWRMVRAAHEA